MLPSVLSTVLRWNLISFRSIIILLIVDQTVAISRAFIIYWFTERIDNFFYRNQSPNALVQPSATNTAPLDGLIKHPLQNQWTLWYYDVENEKNIPWEICQYKIAGFNTVEDFWSLFDHIKMPSEINSGNDYSLFKNGIRPMWQDDTNKNGGRWFINLLKYPNRNRNVDRFWLDVVLLVIGEAFNYSDDVCGVVVNNRRRGHTICKYFWCFYGCHRL